MGGLALNVEILSQLNVRQVPRDTPAPWLDKNTDKFELISDYILKVDGVRFVVPAGYVFDGSSIPRALWWLWPPTYTPAWRASCFHDYCYSHLYNRVPKSWADRVFRATMELDDAPKLTALAFYCGVSAFGHGRYHAETRVRIVFSK